MKTRLETLIEEAKLQAEEHPSKDARWFANSVHEYLTQRTWVGLTNNELQPIADEYRILFGSWVEDFARAIEAKLKEKNI